MEGARNGWAARGGAVLAAALLALAAGCGGSDDDGAADRPGDDQPTTVADSGSGGGTTFAATTTGSDEQQIEATLRFIRARFSAADGEAICAKLTTPARSALSQIGRLTDTKGGCGPQLTAFAKSVKRGQRPVKVRSVRVDGDRAVVVSKGGLVGSAMLPLRLRKVDGEWKLLDTAPVADDVARAHLRRG